MLVKRAIDLELLTPAFIGGAEARIVDKYMPLRPSTVRGMLRFWFRAGAAALLWPRDSSRDAHKRAVDALREAETALFGDTERASPVVVLAPEGGKIERISPPDPAEHPGVRYLGYGLFDDRNIIPEALVTPPGHSLKLTLGLRRALAGAPELLGATAWLWTALGGIGARSRRGFGSIAVIAGGAQLGWPDELCHGADTHAALVQQIVHGLDWVTGVFREHLPKLTQHPLETGDGPHREMRTIDGIGTVTILPVDAATGREALERAGRLFRDFRSTLQRNRLGMPPLPDYFAVKTSIQSRRPPSTLGRAAFGLPLPFYFRSLGGAKARFDPERGDRLASPLCFRVHAIGQGQGRRHVVLLVNLAEANGASPLLGQQIVESGMRSPFPAPDGKLITQFISWAVAEAARAPYARQGRQP